MDLFVIPGDGWLRSERASSKVPDTKSRLVRAKRERTFTWHGSRAHTGSRRRALGKMLLVIGLLVVSLSARGMVSTATSSLQPHAPIMINGNSDFNPSNGVTGGSGTASDTYMIEGWNIASSGTTGISISNTDASFVIRNVYINHLWGGSGSPTPYGINMTNVSSGAIDNSRVYNYNDLSIVMTIVSDVVLNNVIAMPSTILVTNSTHVEVSYSTAELIDIEASSDVQVSNNAHNIDISSSTNVTITDNQSNIPGLKIGVAYSSNITISGNSYACDCVPVIVENSNHVTIIGNDFNGNELDAVVKLANSDFINVSDNKISGDSAGGIVLSSCLQAVIQGNQLSPFSDGYGGVAGVEVSGSHLVNISDNTIAPTFRSDFNGNELDAVVKLANSDFINVSDNKISGDSAGGIVLSSCLQAVIQGNQLSPFSDGYGGVAGVEVSGSHLVNISDNTIAPTF